MNQGYSRFFLPKYNGEKPDGWKPSGERVKRGLYKTAKGLLINSDTNGAANILKKVATQLGLNLVKVGRGSLTGGGAVIQLRTPATM